MDTYNLTSVIEVATPDEWNIALDVTRSNIKEPSRHHGRKLHAWCHACTWLFENDPI